MAGIFENIFTHDDTDSGIKAVGYDGFDDERLKKINADFVSDYDKKVELQKNEVFKTYTQDEVQAIKNKGKSTLLEQARKHKISELTPYYGTTATALKDFKVHNNLSKMRNGQILTPDEIAETRQYVQNMQEEMIRGKTIGGDFIDGLYASVPFLFEAGIGFLTTPEGVGLASLGQTGSKFALRQGAKGYAKTEIRKALQKTARENFKKELTEAGIKSLYNVPKFTVTRTPFQVARRFGEILLDDDTTLTEEGQVVLNEAESRPAIAFMRALGDTCIENFSETSGALLGLGMNGLGTVVHRNMLKRLPKGFSKGFSDLTKKVTGLPLSKALQKYGYHGILEEMGEERVGDFLRYIATPLLQDEGKYTFEGLVDSIFGGHTAEGIVRNAITEGLIFGVTGGGVALGLHGAKKGIDYSNYKATAKEIQQLSLKEDGTYDIDEMKSLIKEQNPKITDEALEKVVSAVQNGISKTDNYSVDDFLLDSGVFRRNGRDSITDSRVRAILEKSNLSNQDKETVMNFATTEDKIQLLNSVKKAGSNEELLSEEDIVKYVQQAEVEEQAYTKLLKGGVSEDVALANSKLFGQFFKRYGAKSKEAFDKWFNKLDVRYNVPAEQQAQKQSFQSAEDRNLIMTHATKSERLDDILANGSLVAPSMAITKKGQKELSEKNFGDILLIRNPELINYKKDNIYDRDIYSPRLPSPDYKTKRGGYVSSYDYDSMKRLNERDPKKFEEVYGMTFEEYFEGAKKVIFDGYTPSGSRKLIDYNSKNLVKWVKREGLIGGESWHYGLSSFLAKLSSKQTSKKTLKKSASTSLQDREEAKEEYEKLSKEYTELLFGEITKYYKFSGNSFQKISDEDFEDIMFAISQNNERLLSEYIDTEKLPKELYDKLKDFVDRASKLPRSYFEAKPLREVSLTEFSYALAEKGTISDKQKKEFAGWGVKVIEYEKGKMNEALEELDNQEEKIYFQSAYHGTPHRFDRFSTEHIGNGEGNQAHGWGLYFAGNKDVSENYRKGLIDKNKVTKYNYDNKPIEETEFADVSTDSLSFVETFGKDKTIEMLEEDIEYAKKWGEDNKNIQRKEILDGNTKYLNNKIKELELVKKIIPEKLVMTEGQLFEVDIPETDEMLDEQKSFLEQPEKVQKAIKQIVIDNGFEDFMYFETKEDFLAKVRNVAGEKGEKVAKEIIEAELSDVQDDIYKAWDKWEEIENELNIDRNNFDMNTIYNMLRGKNYTGKNIYNDLAKLLDSDKEASLLLNKYGIKGITYDGLQDGRCYVVFDDKAVDVIKTYYQESGDSTEKLIAGFTYPEVLEKLTELYEVLGNATEKDLSKDEQDKLMTKIHVLEDAFEVSEYPDKYSNEEQRHEIMLNAYYIMNNQEIPEAYVEADKVSQRTYRDYVDLHKRKKEEDEAKYYGYFTEGNNKNIITIMANSNSSTALHELGHLFLNGLNELARSDENASKQLEAVNKWLGFSGEYTVAQQEKFARSFEAYLYKGKAPNNYLREVFENFKEWLRSVYNHVTELVDKGADISDEVMELFDNMFADDEYYQERKEANELLKKVKNISRKEKMSKVNVRDDSELDEVEKRHKNVAYDIVSVATGKSVKYLKTIFETGSNKKSFGKKRESIEMLLDSVDDKITTSGGMREEWKEFYSDTGVSYENDEIDGDYKLFEQALDTIINKSYRNPEKEFESEAEARAVYYAKAIDEADRQYKVLIRSFEKENRNVALSAIYEWLEGLDKEIKQDYEDKFVFDSAMIDRKENVDKFDKAKRQILSKALEVENRYNLPKDEKYKEVVKEIMKNLNFLNPSDKAKLTTNILDVSSVEFLMSSIDNIMDIAKTMEDVTYRRKLEMDIHKELQKTKNIKKNGRTVGKYDYKTNKIFEELRELDRLSPEQANDLRLEMSRFVTAEDNGLSYKDKLINKFLSYKSGGRTFADTELMKELYDEIMKIKFIGKSAKSELDLTEKLSEGKDIEELIDIVQKKKDAKFLVKGYISGLGNLESTLNAIFNKDIKERYGAEILYAETQAQAWQYKIKTEFEKTVAKIYNLPEWCWDKKIIEYLAEKHTYSEIRRKYDTNGELLKSRNIDRTLSKMDIIQAYIWSKNQVLEKRLINQFGEDTLYAMFDELSLEDVKFAELMMSTAQSFYPMVNRAFIQKYGLDLPKVSCYFPSTPERGSEVDLYNDYSSKSLNNSFTKARAQSETQAMDFHNPVAILYNHIEGVAKFAFMSDSLDRANLRFKDLDLKRVIINKYGKDAYETLMQILANVTYKKEAPVFNGVNKVIDYMVGNWIQANVAIKPIVGLKQLLSANNYAVDMPYMTWQKGFIKALMHPKETIDYVMSIPYIKARYGGSYSNEFLKQTVENSAFALSKKLKDSMNMFIKMGDIGAIIFGGKPYIDYLINEKGMSVEQAHKQFILSTNRSQQSSAVSSLSNFQVAMTRNPMGKLFIAFKNSPQQYVRMCGDAIVSVANGEMSKTQCAKYIFQFAYLQPFLYASATSGSLFRFLFTGDDDDIMKDLQMSIFNLNANAVPLLGDIYIDAMNKLAYKQKSMPSSTPLLGDIQREISKISKEDVTLEDYLEAIGYMLLHVGMGYNSKAIGSMASGVGDIVTGDVAKGSMKVLGYTEKRAKNITKEETEE